MREVPFTQELLAISLSLLGIQLKPLLLDVLLGGELSVIGVDIGNYPSISKSDEHVVNKVAVDRARVEDGEVSVFDARPSEVGVRVSTSMQSHPIDRVALLSAPLYCHSVSHRGVLYISGHLGLPLLINKDELIMVGVCILIDHPSIPRMINIFVSLDAHVSDTSRHSHTLNRVRSEIRPLPIGLDHVNKGGNPG